MKYKIILIKIDHRIQEAASVQSVLTEYGCNIKVRLGLHEVSHEICAQDGMIILHADGSDQELNSMLEKLNRIEFVSAKMIEM
jgi:hypothetical protein